MRQILVERARRRNSLMRRVDFTEAERIGFENPGEIVDFDAALVRLTKDRPSWGEVAQLRVFGGWSTPEIAMILECGESTVRRRWARARAWLAGVLRRGQ